MKKIFLQKITQHNTICYIGKADPRDLVKVATKIEMGVTQDAQRPLNKKKIQEIAKYVSSDKGILPNTLTLSTKPNDKGNKFDVKPYNDVNGIYFIEFPSTKEEFLQYNDTIDVMDGQHRLYAFLYDIRSIEDNTGYEIGFTLYIQPSLSDRRRIFISCNEKQEKVSGNLLMWFKEKLNMLSNEEKDGYDLIQQLNDDLPLKGHIIMGAERISNGIKAKELIATLKQSKINDMSIGEKALTNEQKLSIIRQYLFAWENVVGFSFQTSRKEAGPAIKISGLKYMLFLLPVIWERAISMRIKNSEFQNFFEENIKKLISLFGIDCENFFIEKKMYFRERTGIESLANESIKKIKGFETNDFNPFGG